MHVLCCMPRHKNTADTTVMQLPLKNTSLLCFQLLFHAFKITVNLCASIRSTQASIMPKPVSIGAASPTGLHLFPDQLVVLAGLVPTALNYYQE